MKSRSADTSPSRRPVTGRTGRRVSALAVATLLAAVMAGCSLFAETRDEVGIGVAVQVDRPGMQSILRGVEIAVEQLNAERAGQGRPFTMIVPPADATSAVQLAMALRDDPRVVGVVGHSDSGGSLDAAEIYADSRHAGRSAVVAVSPTATSPALTGRSPWIFRVCPSDVAASRAVAQYVLDSLGARRAAVIYRNDSYGRDWTRAFATVFAAGGGIIVQRDPYLSDRTEWEAYAAYVKLLAPEVILFPGSHQDAEHALRALRAAGVRTPLIGGDAISGLEEKAAEFSGARYTAFFDARRPRTPEGAAFVDRYRVRHGELPDQRAALAYDAALVIGRAVMAEGVDRQRVRDWIAGVGTQHQAIRGATGSIAFDERQDVVDKPVEIATVGGGR